MRLKKQKQHRRAVRFFTVCFGFREPFKVLCDGTFVHHLLAHGITPADAALANTLGAPVKIFTTRCVAAELRSLGDSYSDSFNAARNLLIARCDHERRKSAVACITEIIGENNSEHFFVATQDAELRKTLQEIPGVPLVYALRNALFLERPSTLQREFAKTAEERRSRMTDVECRQLHAEKRTVVTEEAKGISDANEDNRDEQLGKTESKRVKRTGMINKDKVQFKRKKAKGPNPLSCKKKKPKENKLVDGTVAKRIRIRNRKRSRKGSNETA